MPSKLCQTWVCIAATVACLCTDSLLYLSFAVGSHPGGCRRPAPGGCRWTRRSAEASSGPESCAGFCCRTQTHTHTHTEWMNPNKVTNFYGCQRFVWLTHHANPLARPADVCRHLFAAYKNKVAFVGKVKPSWPRTKCVFLTSGCTHSDFTLWRERNRDGYGKRKFVLLRAVESLWVFHWVTHRDYVTFIYLVMDLHFMALVPKRNTEHRLEIMSGTQLQCWRYKPAAVESGFIQVLHFVLYCFVLDYIFTLTWQFLGLFCVLFNDAKHTISFSFILAQKIPKWTLFKWVDLNSKHCTTTK